MESVETPVVSVIIPTYHDGDALKLCLQQLEKQTLAKELYEVLVVDNASPADALPIDVSDSSNVRIINEPRPGSYAARNAAIQIAKGAILAFTDADTLPADDWLEQGLSHFQQSEPLRVAGKVELIASQNPTAAECYELLYSFRQQEQVENLGTSVTANLFVPRSAFDTVGLFNDTLLSGGDFEWGLRAQSAGIPVVYADEVVVKHHCRANYSQLVRKARRVAGGAVKFHNKSAVRVHYEWLRSLLPPLSGWGQLLRSEFSVKNKIIIAFMRYHLNAVNRFEAVRVFHGKTPGRV